jgi:hypothetical protein
MKEETIKKIVNLRTDIITKFEKCKDYRSNKNAIMREIDHAKYLHKIVVSLDDILKGHVKFNN